VVDGPIRATFRTPCVVDATGVTLYRWPRRSVHVPLERVDRFEVVLKDLEFFGDDWAGDSVERLALRTRDGRLLLVSGIVNPRRAPAPASRAQQLNNHIVRLHGHRDR
jgi:hypothetical protein